MKSKIFLVYLIIFCFILFTSKTVAAQNNLQKVIKNYIEKVREDASEYQEARKIVYGDVDGDGVKDAVVQYTLEGFGGGKFFRSFKLQKVIGKKPSAQPKLVRQTSRKDCAKTRKRNR